MAGARLTRASDHLKAAQDLHTLADRWIIVREQYWQNEEALALVALRVKREAEMVGLSEEEAALDRTD